jgi:hypothetical protein
MFPYFHAPRARLGGRLLLLPFLLVLLAGVGLANGAGAAPLTRDKPTRTPGLTPLSDCAPDPRGDLDAHITDHPDHTSAVFTNSSQHCSYHIGLATYMKVDDNIDHQIFYDGQTAVIGPDSTLTLQVGNPPCAYQGDAFWGRMLTSLAGGVRYGERRLDDTDGVNSNYCVVAATATPTQQAAPPTATASATATAAPPTATATSTPDVPTATATATAIPPSATATATPMPPTATATNTPTNTPTPGAQKVRPTHTPTPIPAGSPPAPTATATSVTVVAPPPATSTPGAAPPTATTGVSAPPATATATAVLVPPEATAPAGGAPPTNTPAPVVGGIGAPPAATATHTPVSAPPGTTGGAGEAPPSERGAGPVSQVGPLVGSNNGPAPSELPRTGTPDLGWLLGLVVAGLALASGLLLRRRTS